MLYSSMNDYARVEQALLKKPMGDPMAAFKSLAKNTTCTAYSCYALSCLGCCCCTKCAQLCLGQGDIGNAWEKSMDALYASKTLTERRVIFLNALQVLHEIHALLERKMKQRDSIVQETLNQGNALAYTSYELSFLILTQELDNGTWIQSVFKPVRNYLLNIPQANPTLSPIVLTVHDTVHLTPDMYRTLALAIGFFLPATQTKYGLSAINIAEIGAIRVITADRPVAV